MRFKGKVAMVTGASSGIGAACARLFAAEGAAVALVDLDDGAARRICQTLMDSSGREPAIALGLDVTDPAAVDAGVSAIIDALGRIDVLVNSAGITARNLPEGTNWLAAWDRVMEVNVKGTLLPSIAVMEHMRQNDIAGSVVNLSSIYGQVARPPALNTGPDPYTHSKATVVQLTRDLAVSGAPDRIRVNCLCPGFIRTALTAELLAREGMERIVVDLHPLKRLGEPEEVAACALFLASDAASFVTGAALPVDGGYLAI